MGKSLKNIPIVAIIFLYNSIAFAQQAIHLKCQSNVTQYSKMGKFENEFKFDLTITESNNFIEFSSSPSLAGGSIFLNTSPSSIIKYGQVKNNSNADVWDFDFNLLQPNGQIATKNSFRLNRFTGTLKVSSTSSDFTGISEGSCIKASAKLF